MAVNLKAKWNQHAFPDDGPAKELQWAEDAERHRIETRREVYLEQTTDLRIKRHTSDRDQRADAKAAKDQMLDNMMLLAVGSPEYQAAYNNELSFTIGGEDIEITQGELHDLAKQRAEDLQEQIDAAKRRGASDDEIARLQSEFLATARIARNTNPQNGLMDDDRRAAVRDDLQQAPGLVDVMKQEGPQPPAAHEIQTMDSSEATARVSLAELNGSQGRGSVATEIGDSPIAALDVALRQNFTAAVANTQVPDEQAPATPNQIPGFDFG